MGVMSSADPVYRIANASQFASMSAAVAISTEESCADWFEAVTSGLSDMIRPDGGGGGGAGGPCVTPPSANAVAEMDAKSRQVPKNRVSFDIFWFPFDDALVGNPLPKSAGLY